MEYRPEIVRSESYTYAHQECRDATCSGACAPNQLQRDARIQSVRQCCSCTPTHGWERKEAATMLPHCDTLRKQAVGQRLVSDAQWMVCCCRHHRAAIATSRHQCYVLQPTEKRWANMMLKAFHTHTPRAGKSFQCSRT